MLQRLALFKSVKSSRLPPHFSWKKIRERKKEIVQRDLDVKKKFAGDLARIPMLRHVEGYAKIKELASNRLKTQDTVVVAVSGPQGSGKSSLVSKLCMELDGEMVSTDLYFKSPEFAEKFPLYFDDPKAVKLGDLEKHIKQWKSKKGIEVPVHDLVSHKQFESKKIPYKRVLFVEGFMAFHPKIRKHCDLKIYIDSSSCKRLRRRLKRDVNKRGRNPPYVRDRFYSTLEESRLKFLEKWKTNADIIIVS